MKKIMLIMAMMVTIVTSASAISLNKARSEALYLSDKMAYVLNLSDDQYNAVYEINLDYILEINLESDIFGYYWNRRNQEMSYVLSPSQYSTFRAMEYFYRPITWTNNRFVYVIHHKYPENRYYRSAPRVYKIYKGGNRIYKHSPYQGRKYNDKTNPAPLKKYDQHPTIKRSQAIKDSWRSGATKSNNKTKSNNDKKNNGKSHFGNR